VTDRHAQRRQAGEVRRRAEQLRLAEEAKARRRRTAVVAGAAVAVLVLVVLVGYFVQSNRGSTTASGGATPANLVGGGVVVGAAAPVTVTVYEDFQCPVCKAFEQTTGPTLDALREAGTVQVVEKPVAILDRVSKDRYSTRSLNAAGCLVNSTPSAFPAFKTALFAQQPEECSRGLTDAQLTTIAEQTGAPGLGSCISSGTYDGWAARTTDQASKDGLTGTPYVLVDGKQLEQPTPDALKAAVAAAAK
jgi:protein-disulfide isomerase